ncbi:MAG: hypothetical protein JW709_10975 [Sedimentisphaerales bacterium]|nr:hypothetical protein [Sedimentisphaerales bacterium]
MLLSNLLNRGSVPVLEKVMEFTEARHEVLANNVSNFDTVGYKVKDLPAEEFFTELRQAVERRASGGGGAQLELKSTTHFSRDNNGSLQARAQEIEDNNILFHDENNRFVEKQMAAMSKNALLHNVAAELLKMQYEGLQTAIRGRL